MAQRYNLPIRTAAHRRHADLTRIDAVAEEVAEAADQVVRAAAVDVVRAVDFAHCGWSVVRDLACVRLVVVEWIGVGLTSEVVSLAL